MRDLLITTLSILIILFCISLLVVSGESESNTNEMLDDAKTVPGAQRDTLMTPKTILFTKIQSVKIRKGILIFVTFENLKLKSHYFQIRDKNVIIVRNNDSDMPLYSIKFTDNGCNTLVVTISDTLDIDLLEEMSAS
ncbi:MAG: hypothetical protein K0U86_06580 [Planctomycetes bacterium]|nr:hypothetical protein [Planctomycetota bacterium]MCH9724553.1 hypothetical protein [Planctomycetota bacterium]MCH9779407.1 hypothetical protein [Planctomycetota bacterium]